MAPGEAPSYDLLPLMRAVRVRGGSEHMSIRGNWEKRRVETVSRRGEMDRRTFVKLSGAGAAALIFGTGPYTERASAQVQFSAYPFSLGVASGDPLPNGLYERARAGLEGHGLQIVERVPLETKPTAQNLEYLRAKREKLGHLLSNVEEGERR
jgi:hypothetical protein